MRLLGVRVPTIHDRRVAARLDAVDSRHATDPALVAIALAAALGDTPTGHATLAGSVQEYQITSRHQGGSRRLWVYTPPGYTSRDTSLGTILVFDGGEYLSASGSGRWPMDEGIPLRHILDSFSQSGAFWRGSEASNGPPYEWLTTQAGRWPRSAVRLWLAVGSTESRGALGGSAPSILSANRALRDTLRAKGYDVTYIEVPNGVHAAQTWGPRLPVGIAGLLGRK